MEEEKCPERTNVEDCKKDRQRCTGVRLLRCGIDQPTSVSRNMHDTGARSKTRKLQLARAVRADGIPVTLRAIPLDLPADLPGHRPQRTSSYACS